MNDRHRDQHALIAALGHSSRFRIALCLLEGDRCVSELARAIGLSQSCTTRHVQALERAGVVHSRRDGKRVLVGLEVERTGVPELLAWLEPEAVAGGSPDLRRAPVPAPRTAGPRTSRRGRRGRLPSPAASGPSAAGGEDGAPAAAPASGTPPAPVEAPAFRPLRPRETLEDFLL